MDRVEAIREASAKLRALHGRIHETFRTRDRGPDERERWEVACKEFHARYSSLFYPDGEPALEALRGCGSGAIQTAIDFLVADPMHFRSGYTKEYVWARLLQCSLLPDDKQRLEDAALGYTRCRIDRAFWSMGRAMGRIASPEFWTGVDALTKESNSDVSTRASYLLVFKESAAAGGLLRRRINNTVLDNRYRAKHGTTNTDERTRPVWPT
jgi:hypothetical protein